MTLAQSLSFLLIFLSFSLGIEVIDVYGSTDYGRILGDQISDGDPELGNRRVNVFLGIPYAAAPVNETRFLAPKEPEKWEGTLKTQSYAPQCYWYDPDHNDLHRSSLDCLHLNVFQPVKLKTDPPSKRFPVLFFIHDGDYTKGSAHKYDATSIARFLPSQHGVIVVTFNYRLGILGFYTTGNEVSPGNQGLWDMASALKWTYSNIRHFDGDNKRITVAGYGSGSMAAELLSLSPETRRYVNQLYLMSGTNDFQWEPKQPNEIFNSVLRNAKKELKYKPAKNDLAQELTDFLLDLEPILLKVYDDEKPDKRVTIWRTYGGAFLNRSLADMRKNANRVPTLVGTTRYEAQKFIKTGWIEEEVNGTKRYYSLRDYKLDAERFLARYFLNKDEEWMNNLQEAGKILNELGAGRGEEFSLDYMRSYIEVMSDFLTTNGIYKYTQDHVATSNSPLYVYAFDYIHSSFYREEGRTAHGDDLPFLIPHITRPRFTGRDLQVQKHFSTYVANFIKYGNPNGEPKNDDKTENKWKPVDKSGKVNHLVYDYYKNEQSSVWFDERHKKWEHIWRKYKSAASISSINLFTILLAYLAVFGL